MGSLFHLAHLLFMGFHQLRTWGLTWFMMYTDILKTTQKGNCRTPGRVQAGIYCQRVSAAVFSARTRTPLQSPYLELPPLLVVQQIFSCLLTNNLAKICKHVSFLTCRYKLQNYLQQWAFFFPVSPPLDLNYYSYNMSQVCPR